mgnify:FL=1
MDGFVMRKIKYTRYRLLIQQTGITQNNSRFGLRQFLLILNP